MTRVAQAGDEQSGGKAYNPIAIFGAWTYATEAGTAGTPVKPNQTQTPYNLWNLSTTADPLPATIQANCPCTGTPGSAACPGTGLTGRGYGAEVKYEAGLMSGHSYRLQIIGHDGDQTQGGDSGESCVDFCAAGTLCTPKTCADYPNACGPQSDGCTGFIDCGPCPCEVNNTCNCTATSCEQNCPAPTNGGPAKCQTSYDLTSGYILQCLQFDGLCNSFNGNLLLPHRLDLEK